jgi:hypothetical protein
MDMYIEFSLPKDTDGPAAIHVNQILVRELDRWSKQHGIDYNTKNIKYTKRVTFDDDASYSFFAMSWAPKSGNFESYLLNYRLIEPMNRL